MAKNIVIDARIIDSTTGRYVRGLLQGLSSLDLSDLNFTFLVPSSSIEAWQKLYKNFRFLPCDIKNYSLAEQTKLRKVLRDLSPDLVHFSMPQQPLRYSSSPVVTTFHDLTLLRVYNSDKNWLTFRAKQLVGRFVFWRALKKSVAVLTPSDYTREDIIKTFKVDEEASEDIVTVHLAGEIPKSPNEKVIKKSNFTPPKNYLLYVGNQADYKNIPTLMEAHKYLLKSHPDLHLVLASPPDKATKKNKRLAEREEYEQVIFTGWLSSDELKDLYKNCACYVFPSLMEGFGLPGLEAMGQGAPAASSNATCLPEIYGDGALYFSPRAGFIDMALAIEKVLSDEELRKDLLAHGKEQFARYDWKITAKETLQVYRDVLDLN